MRWILIVSSMLSVARITSAIAERAKARIVTPTGSSMAPMPSLPPLPSLPPISTLPPLSSVPTLPPLTLPALNITLPTLRPNMSLPQLPLIDPRAGGTVSLKLQDVEVFSNGIEPGVTQPPESEGSITFPKSKRSVDNSRYKRQANCGCFLTSSCPANVTSTTTPAPNTNGAGLIDFRIVGGSVCMTDYTFCCIKPAPQITCGSRLTTNMVYPTQPGQAKYGDYPWMVVIITSDNQYVGGGTLIDTQHVITTAHRISNYPNGAGLKIRLGEWDAAGTYEQYPYKDYPILKVFTHESFNPNSLQNDLALIRLSTTIGTLPNVIPACMPNTGQTFDGLRCWVAGWGKDSFGVQGTYQAILKAIDVPVLTQSACETTLRTTRLGTAFVLDRTSFLCAGGETNKDACTGDGGSGLVCEVSGRWVLAGMVAWGIGCAAQGVPAAYVNITNYLPWITAKQIAA